jgi:hypothetical protein
MGNSMLCFHILDHTTSVATLNASHKERRHDKFYAQKKYHLQPKGRHINLCPVGKLWKDAV